MKNACFLLLFFLIGGTLQAQAPQWAWVNMQNGSGLDRGGDCMVDAHGNIYVDYLKTIQNLFLGKYDVSGQLIRTDSLLLRGSYTSLNQMIRDHAGNLIIGGIFQYNINIGPFLLTCRPSSVDAYYTFVAKLDTNGKVLWTKVYGGRMDLKGLVVDTRKNIYMSSYLQGKDSIGSFFIQAKGSAEGIFTKMDENGQVLWVKQISSKTRASGMSICISKQDIIYVSGGFKDTAIIGQDTLMPIAGSNHIGAIWMASYDTSGHLNWLTKMGGSDEDMIRAMTVDLNGDILLTGVYYDTAYFGNQIVTNTRRFSPFIAKYDATGDIKWVRSLNGKGRYGDTGLDITTDASGNVYSMGQCGDSTRLGTTLLKDKGMFVAKWDSTGNLLWGKGVAKAEGSGICLDNQNSIYVTGFYTSGAKFEGFSIPNAGEEDMFLAKLSSATGIAQQTNSNADVLIYPNPNNGAFDMKYPKGFNSFQVVDVRGSIIYQQSLSSTQHEINVVLPEVVPGLYFILLKGQQNSANRKIVIQ